MAGIFSVETLTPAHLINPRAGLALGAESGVSCQVPLGQSAGNGGGQGAEVVADPEAGGAGRDSFIHQVVEDEAADGFGEQGTPRGGTQALGGEFGHQDLTAQVAPTSVGFQTESGVILHPA